MFPCSSSVDEIYVKDGRVFVHWMAHVFAHVFGPVREPSEQGWRECGGRRKRKLPRPCPLIVFDFLKGSSPARWELKLIPRDQRKEVTQPQSHSPHLCTVYQRWNQMPPTSIPAVLAISGLYPHFHIYSTYINGLLFPISSQLTSSSSSIPLHHSTTLCPLLLLLPFPPPFCLFPEAWPS